MPSIKTVDLTKYYVDKKNKTATAVLYKLSAEIPDKSFTVIMGLSGSGKTTFLKTLAGLIKSDEGGIFFDGKDVTDSLPSSRGVSYLSQEYALYPHLTVFDNIAYPLKTAKVPAEEIRRRVNEICSALDITLLSSRKPRVLSGGQQQRVALARALVKQPDAVLLDEPLSNLDEHTRRSLAAEFAAMQKKLGLTFVYVTHNTEEARTLADHLIVIDNGAVVQSGSPDALFRDRGGFFFNNILYPPEYVPEEREKEDFDDEIV